MTKVRLIFSTLALIISSSTIAQEIPSHLEGNIIHSTPKLTTVACEDLSWLIRNPTQRNVGFPWNGCGEFTITVNLEFIEIETVVVVCCVEGICIPNIQLPNNVDLPDDLIATIEDSDSVRVGAALVSIRPGSYAFHRNGELIGLQYQVQLSK